MANGTGLNGNSSSSQSAIIAKQPGNANIYYIFTQSGPSGAGAAYSVVDIGLAAGIGSVTVKNTTLSASCTEKLTSVKHCNGVDIWVIYHGWGNAEFKSYLLTSSGVNTTAVISAIGTTHSVTTDFAGCMKTSPSGKKIGLGIYGKGLFELFDFDNTTGVISNSLSLNTGSIVGAYGCEFSSDGTKFYGSRGISNALGQLFQWDLCAGSPTAIAASLFTVVTTNTTGIGALQRASDGKIYGTRSQQSSLISINNPNAAGVACNYVEMGLSIAPKTSYWSLPNFMTSFNRPPSPSFTHTRSCNTVSFSAQPLASGSGTSCQNATFSLTSVLWDFGDQASGAANISMFNSPVHLYPAPGTYTTQLILYYSCGGGNDTLKQPITIADVSPTLNIAGNFTICQSEKRTYTVTGASTYSWNSGGTSSTLSIGPSASTATYNVVGTSTAGCSSKKIFTVTVNKCTSLAEQSENTDLVVFYPNPASSGIHMTNKEKTEIVMLNVQGKVLFKGLYEPGDHELDISGIEDGLYYLKTVSSGGCVIRSFVKRGD